MIILLQPDTLLRAKVVIMTQGEDPLTMGEMGTLRRHPLHETPERLSGQVVAHDEFNSSTIIWDEWLVCVCFCMARCVP